MVQIEEAHEMLKLAASVGGADVWGGEESGWRDVPREWRMPSQRVTPTARP